MQERTTHHDFEQHNFGQHDFRSSESDGPFQNNLVGRMFYLFTLLRIGESQIRRGSGHRGVLQGQGRVLHMLALHSPVTQKDLAYLLGIRPQSLSELLTKLEAAGQIVRKPDPQDKRTWIVDITEEGRKADESRPEMPADPFDMLSPEQQEELISLLDKVIDGLEQRLPHGVDRRLQMMRRAWTDGQNPWNRRGPGQRWGRKFDQTGHPDERSQRFSHGTYGTGQHTDRKPGFGRHI